MAAAKDSNFPFLLPAAGSPSCTSGGALSKLILLKTFLPGMSSSPTVWDRKHVKVSRASFMSCTAMFPARLKCSRRDKGKSSRFCLRFGQTIAPGARAVAIGPADPEAWDSLLEGAKAAPLLPSGSPGIGASVRGLALRAGTGGCSFRRLDCEISSMASTSASSSSPSSPSKIPGRIFQSSSSSSGTGGKSLETACVVGISLGFSVSSSCLFLSLSLVWVF